MLYTATRCPVCRQIVSVTPADNNWARKHTPNPHYEVRCLDCGAVFQAKEWTLGRKPNPPTATAQTVARL